MDQEEKDLKRLQFFVDRFLEHIKAIENQDEKLTNLLDRLANENSELYKAKEVLKNFIAFYIDCLKFSIVSRNFIAYTYPLAYRIKNLDLYNLFAENQYQLFYTLEKFTKCLEDNPVEDFYIIKKGEFYADDYSKVTIKLKELMNNLKTQFKNAREEFVSKKFLELFDKNCDTPLPKLRKKFSKENNKVGGNIRNDLWDCNVCTYHNVGNSGNRCVICQQIGR